LFVCAGHGAQRHDRRCQPARETEPASDLEVRVLWRPWWRELLAEQQPRHREVAWEGSCRQSPGPRNTNRIGGGPTVGEGAQKSEARSHPDRQVVYAAGMWGESHAPYPGRAADSRERQQSAEAVVAVCARRRRAEHEEPNWHETFDA
jgi:hypothetical protein